MVKQILLLLFLLSLSVSCSSSALAVKDKQIEIYSCGEDLAILPNAEKLDNEDIVFKKERTLEEHIKEYTDCHGRPTLNNPNNQEECMDHNYDNNNAILWSGEMAMLMKEVYGEIPAEYKKTMLDMIDKHFSSPGVLSRHPDPYRFSKDWKPISFDEYTGVAFLASVIPEFKDRMDEVVKHGKKNDWQFWDLPGHEKGKSWFTILHPKAIRQLYDYLQEESLRKSTVKYPRLYPIFATHHIHQRAFYKMMSKSYSPSLFEEFYFAQAGAFAAHKDNWSTLSMWLFRYQALDNIGYDGYMLRKSKEYFFENVKKRFGPDYRRIIFKNFYENQDHPFHRMIPTPKDTRVDKPKVLSNDLLG